MGVPLIDYSLQSTWQAMYDLDAEPEAITGFRPHSRLQYHRSVLMRLAREQARAYATRLGWQPTNAIAIIGCGFGWTIEILTSELGIPNVVGTDTSAFIQATKGLTEEADVNAAIIAVGLDPAVGDGAALKAKLFDGGTRARRPVLNEDGSTIASRAAIKTAAGGVVDIVLTETLLETWSDSDCLTISRALHKLAPTVQHLIDEPVPVKETSNPLVVGNRKTLAQWKALLPADTFMRTGDYQVLL